MVRVNPKLTPDAVTMMLFGPGVNAIATANATSPRNMSIGMS
jgi:hypothetical protein